MFRHFQKVGQVRQIRSAKLRCRSRHQWTVGFHAIWRAYCTIGVRVTSDGIAAGCRTTATNGAANKREYRCKSSANTILTRNGCRGTPSRRPNVETILQLQLYAYCLYCAYPFAIVADGASITERTSRRVRLSRRCHITGFAAARHRRRGARERARRDFVTVAAFLDSRASITSQPISLSFRHGGQPRRYTPDFRVRWSSRRTELIEVKYQADLDANEKHLGTAFEAAHAWAKQNGAIVRGVTEHDICGPMLVNAKPLLPLRRLLVEREIAIRVLTGVGTLEKLTFGQVVAALKVNRSVTVATGWRLIARGQLRIDVTSSITFNTMRALP
jgi:hypothetical protein